VNVSVRVDHGAKPETRRIHLQSNNNNQEFRLEFELTIMYLPQHFQAIGTETEKDDNGVNYYKRIRLPLNDKIAFEFLLIPQQERNWKANARLRDLRTFYISRFKISREQFRWFAEQNPKIAKDVRWKEHVNDNDRMPVRHVIFKEALAFANSLGCRIPSCDQWDKAAGRYHPLRGEGPYIGSWNDQKKPRIAVGELKKPCIMDSPETAQDVSIYGCRGMAGNGVEWTRTMPGRKEDVLDRFFGTHDEDLYTRGGSFKDNKPLSFQKLDDDELQQRLDLEKSNQTSEDIGFRIVLEPKS
jgi:formylglycine-generating enzyme required for sulfatase activity